VVGSKHWKIYQKVPIPYCYPHEQVGKEGLEVPPEVLNGPILHETTLKPGDVLYLPRGYVHEARATEKDLSFHVTIAIATHDWTLAGTMTKATDKILHSVFPFRMAMDRHIGMDVFNDVPQQVKKTLQMQIDEAFRMLKEEITAETVAQNQENKFRNHNKRAFEYRMGIIQKIQAASSEGVEEHKVIVGPEAAKRIRGDTYIRAATEEEKASVMMDRPRGLQVREQAADEIIRILQALKEQPTLHCKVKDLKSLLGGADADDNTNASGYLCDLTLLSFARVCVEQGALALANKE
jgi:hypothetical protein